MSAPNLSNPATPSDPAGYTGPVEHGASPVPHAAPTHPGAPQVPPGWITQWSQEHNSWYYVYTATGLTQWDYPAASAKQDPASTGPALASPSPNDQPVHEQQTYDHDPNGPPGPDGDRGLGKAALVVGGGILAAASFGPLGKKLGPKLSAFFGNKPQQQPSTQSQSYGSGYPPTSQSHSYGSGYAAAPQAHTYGAGYAASPQPPPAYYGQPQYAAGPMNAGAGHTNVAPSSGVQPLRIYAAMFADKDVTQILRSLVTPQQSVSLTGNTLVKQFGNPWPETERQAFSVLYQYGERPMEAFTADTETGIIEIRPEALSRKRMDFCQPSPSRIIALLWGTEDVCTLGRRQQLEKDGEMEGSKELLGDGGFWGWEPRTLVCYWRTDAGEVRTTCCKEGGTLRLPWNPLAKWS